MENIVQGQWFRGPSADLGAPIDQSIRFQSANSTEFTRTFGTPTDRDRWTFSVWVKKAKFNESTRQVLLSGYGASNDNQWLDVGYESGNGLFYTSNGYTTNTNSTAVYRDPSAWQHVVATWDGSNLKMYSNGVRVINDTQLSGDVGINGPHAHTIGDTTNGSQRINCYMAEMNFLDGTLVGETASGSDFIIDEFGRYNEDGIWVPKAISFTSDQYGNNGFRLTFASDQHATASTAIGIDSAPTGGNHDGANNWTASGFDTAAISSSNPHNDVDIKDTPTNNWITLNPLNATTGATLTGGNLFYGQSSNSQGASASQELRSGKWYFEVQKSANHNPEIGIMPIQDNFAGVSPVNTGNYIAVVTNNATLLRDGTSNTDAVSYTSMTGEGVIGCAIDMDDKKIWWTDLNGNWQTGNPADGSSPGLDFTGLDCADGCVPHIQIHTSSAHSVFVKFGQMDFIHTVPAGYKAIQSNEQPEPTIKNGKDHFEVILWDGNGVDDRNITTTEGFAPDLVWIKCRNAGENHTLFDSVRGATKRIIPNFSNAEDTQAEDLQAFNSDGFQIGTNDRVNKVARTYVAWCWKGGGTAVSNTDGTITSSVSANTDAGFSIVSYTGTGEIATVGHGLNSPPEFVITKNREVGANWAVGSDAIDNWGTALYLNETQAKEPTGGSSFWNSLAPTSSVINLGSYGNTNGSGNGMIAYCWHSVEGFSKIGSYTGNGASDGPFIYTGFKPAMVILKRIDSTSNWHIRDAERNPNNPDTDWMEIDNAAAEQTGNAGYNIDYLANGFKWRGTVLNVSGGNYVYIAFASNPFGGENAAPVTAR